MYPPADDLTNDPTQGALMPLPQASPVPQAPMPPALAPPVSQNPKQQLMMLAALAAAIAGGRRSPLAGLPGGVMAGQQQLQQTADRNTAIQARAQAEQEQKQQQLIQRSQQADANREKLAQSTLADLQTTVPTIKDPQTYEATIQQAVDTFAGIGKSRINAQLLRQRYPFVPTTTEDKLKSTAKDWLAFNGDAIKKDQSLLDKAMIDFDLQDTGTSQRYPARVLLQQAGYPMLQGQDGKPLVATPPEADLSGSEMKIRTKAALDDFVAKNHRKPNAAEFKDLVDTASQTPKSPAERQKQALELQKLQREMGLIKPVDIPVGSPHYRIAQDLAYGKLTFAQFRSLYPARAASAAEKQAVYDLAGQLNQNFNPAAFEMGFKFASSAQSQRALAAVDNVMPNIDKVIALSDTIQRSDLPSWNALLNSTRFQLGNRKVTNFRQMQKLIGDELGVALGAGAMTDMKLKLGLDVVDPNLGPDQFKTAMENIKEFLVNRKQSLLSQMGVYGQAGMNPGANDPASTGLGKLGRR